MYTNLELEANGKFIPVYSDQFSIDQKLLVSTMRNHNAFTKGSKEIHVKLRVDIRITQAKIKKMGDPRYRAPLTGSVKDHTGDIAI